MNELVRKEQEQESKVQNEKKKNKNPQQRGISIRKWYFILK